MSTYRAAADHVERGLQRRIGQAGVNNKGLAGRYQVVIVFLNNANLAGFGKILRVVIQTMRDDRNLRDQQYDPHGERAVKLKSDLAGVGRFHRVNTIA